MLRVPVLEKTPQGLALYIDDATISSFAAKKPMRWLGGRCANGYHEPIMSQLLIEYLRAHPTAVFSTWAHCLVILVSSPLQYQRAKQKSLNLK